VLIYLHAGYLQDNLVTETTDLWQSERRRSFGPLPLRFRPTAARAKSFARAPFFPDSETEPRAARPGA